MDTTSHSMNWRRLKGLLSFVKRNLQLKAKEKMLQVSSSNFWDEMTTNQSN